MSRGDKMKVTSVWWPERSNIFLIFWMSLFIYEFTNYFQHIFHSLSVNVIMCTFPVLSSRDIWQKWVFFCGKMYFWANICPNWASRVLDNIQGKYGTNQNCFRTRLAQNSNFIRPGLTFCHPGTMRWPGHIWSARLEIFVNSDKKVLWEREKALKTWR